MGTGYLIQRPGWIVKWVSQLGCWCQMTWGQLESLLQILRNLEDCASNTKRQITHSQMKERNFWQSYFCSNNC